MSSRADKALDAQLRTFAAHLRDPRANPPPPGIEDRRLAVYRELFFNNIRELLSGNFPVSRRTLGEAVWGLLVHDFHARHRAHSPLFPEIGQEFQQFLRARADAGAGDPHWLVELAHYEWVELALQLALEFRLERTLVAGEEGARRIVDEIELQASAFLAVAGGVEQL